MNSIGALVAIYRIFGLSRQHDLQKKNIVIIPTTKSTTTTIITIIPNKIYHLFHGFHAFKNRDGQCFRIWIGKILVIYSKCNLLKDARDESKPISPKILQNL